MFRSLRLLHSFCKRLNPPFAYNTIPVPQIPTISNKYLIGEIVNNRYLNNNWRELANQAVSVAGWVRNVRVSNKVMFINLFDGTAAKEIQIVIDREHPGWGEYSEIKKGYSLKLEGVVKEIVGGGSGGYEVFVGAEQKVEVLGECDPAKYVLSAKNVKLQTVRDYLHLRSKTLRMAAISRIRSTLSYATHTFYQSHNFVHLHTPIITTSDCQGAGQMFHVTTLFNQTQLPKTKQGAPDFTKDFFKRSAGLTVSGQLAAEAFCCGMSKVYTFGPTFRAEVSNTTRHVAEFWMIEPEIAFADLEDAMDLAEGYVKTVVGAVLEERKDDLVFLEGKKEGKDGKGGTNMTMSDNLKHKISNFKRITYTDAITLLQQSPHKFESPTTWGCDLSTQHQRYLCQHITKCPTFVYNYPASIKPFYMRQNPDGKTVASFDLLVPGIGEMIGGSQREERLEYLEKRMDEMGVGKENLDWYLDLRRFGTVPHAGFGVGFDRLVMFCTETENIRDVVPFPRTPGRADC